MKKFILIIPLTILLSGLYIVKSYAYSYVTYLQEGNGYSTQIWDDNASVTEDNNYYWVNGYKWRYNSFYHESYGEALAAAINAVNNNDIYGRDSLNQPYEKQDVYFNGIFNTNLDLPHFPENPPEPPEPEPGSTWLSDVWEWFLWQLGINDDYSGDIDVYITGGDREPFEMVTPSPTPTPTPEPTPTPYTLNIIDNNGNSVYTITGIPGSTYNITNTTNNNDGSDFDIFEVDLKIGDGGSTNPRDGLNDVMDTSLTYLSDSENVDMKPVGDSFSIIPNDWFLLLGVVACFPFIAGFISKLLK